MKLRHLLSSAAAVSLLIIPTAVPGQLPIGTQAAYAQSATVGINIFFDDLAAQGTWVSHPRHRYVWIPTDVEPSWEPYTRGRWVHTDRYGWYFASDEPFAWAVYHYGRWAFEPGLGWYWVPGTVWAPAWVSWRQGDDHIGWAPLPPEGDGFAVRVEVSSSEPPRGYWHFVPVAEFAAPSLAVVIIDDGSFFQRTEYVGPVVVQNNIVINNVIDIDFVRERATSEITTVDVQVVEDPAEAKAAGEQGAVIAVESELAAPTDDAAPAEAVEPTQVEAPTANQDLEAPAEGEAPADEPAAEEAPDEGEAPADEPAAEEAPDEGEAPADEPAAEEAPDEGEAPADEPAAEEAPDEEEAPADEPAAEEAPVEGEAPSDECLPADREAGRC